MAIPKVVILLGVSRSGKGELARIFVEHGYEFESEDVYAEMHPISDLKRFLERHYRLPMGFADSPGKMDKVVGANSKTLQEVMVGLYHFFQEYDSEFSIPYVEWVLKGTSTHPNIQNTVWTGVRRLAEAKLFSDYAGNHKIKLIVVDCVGREGGRESTDENYEEIKGVLEENACFSMTLRNDSTLEGWHEKGRKLLRKLESI